MPKRKRTEANTRADCKYRSKRKQVLLNFHEENDAELLAKLRSRVSSDAELPKYLKALIESVVE